jgi:hypothetical protein
MIQPPEYMTPKQAAAYVGMSTQWLLDRFKMGNGPPHKRRGSRILIMTKDLIKWDENKNIP